MRSRRHDHARAKAPLLAAGAGALREPGYCVPPECAQQAGHGADPALLYSIDRDAGLLRMRWRGAVSSAEVGQFWTRMLEDHDALAVGRHLDDLRDCRFTFSGNEWLELVKSFLVPAPPHARWKAAFVVNSAEVYGVLRQFIAYAGDLVEAEIFDDLALAEAWLVQRSPDRAGA